MPPNVKRYNRLKDPTTGVPLCYQNHFNVSRPKIRSKLECSTKCANYNDPNSPNTTACNSFLYSYEVHQIGTCQLFLMMCDNDFLNALPTENCAGYVDVDARVDTVNESIPRISSLNCNFPLTYNGGLFYSCSSELPGLDNACGRFMCLTAGRQLAICLSPLEFQVVNTTIQLTIPTFASPTPVVSVNAWTVIQQRINALQSFDQTWAVYKAGFGVYDGNFWMGLEKIYQLTSSSNYRLRFLQELGSEAQNYFLNVSGHRGDLNWDPLNANMNGQCQNEIGFSTTDRFLSPSYCELGSYSGNWFSNCYCVNLNGVYGRNFVYCSSPYNLINIDSCRMMIKLA